MDKIKLNFKKIENAIFFFDGQTVEVVPYIDLGNKLEIINNYITNYYSQEDDISGFWNAETCLMLEIIDKFTNIDIEKNKIDDIIKNGLWREIIYRIGNYATVRDEIKEAFRLASRRESYEHSFKSLVESIGKFIDEIMKVDLSKEGLETLARGLKSETDKLSDIYPTIKESTPRKKRAKKDEHV